jgi:peptidoglycan/LPS O-acetylase OafA/YrhL
MEARTPVAAGRPRDLAIDVMRAVAILLVVGYHAGPLAWRMPPWDDAGVLRPPSLGAWWLAVPVLHFGYAGVHLFFVISGFCIHASCRLGLDVVPWRGEGARRYAWRRLVRIAPPYWIALLVYGLVLPSLAGGSARPAPWPPWRDLGLHALFLHGFSPRTIFSVDPAFWSLATEMEFYVAYPLAAFWMLRVGVRRVLVAALLVSIAWRAAVLAALPPTPDNFMVYRVALHGFFVPRFYEWLLGCALAEAVIKDGGAAIAARARPAAWGGFALLALGALCRLHVVVDKLFADSLISTGFALLVGWRIGVGQRAEAGARPSPAARVLAAIGRRSYSVYLVHQPILDGDWLPLGPRLLIAAVASTAFWRWLERPFERAAGRIGRARRPPAPGAEQTAG